MSKQSENVLLMPGESGWEIWTGTPATGFALQTAGETSRAGDLTGLPAGDLTLLFPVKSFTAVPLRVTSHDEALFGDLEGAKAERAAQAAAACGNVVVYKGPDTLVAAPDGRVGFAPPAPAWLASAGTGDVLAGIIAALRARKMDAFDAACAGVWIHGRAAEKAGPDMIADDLIDAIPLVLP